MTFSLPPPSSLRKLPNNNIVEGHLLDKRRLFERAPVTRYVNMNSSVLPFRKLCGSLRLKTALSATCQLQPPRITAVLTLWQLIQVEDLRPKKLENATNLSPSEFLNNNVLGF